MVYAVRPLGTLGGRTVMSRMCAPDEEFCDDSCVKLYTEWATNNRRDASCLTNDQRHALIDACEAVHLNKTMSPDEAAAIVNPILDDPCGPRFINECEQALRTWAEQKPEQAVCLSPDDMQSLAQACVQWRRGEISAETWQAALDDLVARGCPPRQPPAPAPAPPPPVQPPPVPEPPLREGVVVDPFREEAVVYTPPPALHEEPRTGYRRWGPIVGALLIVGGAIYLLR